MGIECQWEVSTDQEFEVIIQSGTLITNISIDYTVKVDVKQLKPLTRYYYRFLYAGRYSAIGKTKTLPDKDYDLKNLKIAVVSCSNYPEGFFNAYRNIAKRDDVDVVIHLGDYICNLKSIYSR
jgi:alkaline phosphatase D